MARWLMFNRMEYDIVLSLNSSRAIKLFFSGLVAIALSFFYPDDFGIK